MKRTVYFSLGTNMGDRLEMLKTAAAALAEIFGEIKKSSVWETAPWGVTEQNSFFNMCVSAETELEGEEILKEINKIEAGMGRVRTIKWGPRVIDIDIILIGEEIINSEKLKVPHPYMCERVFVLRPLAEIAAGARHPVNGKTVRELFEALPKEQMTWIAEF